MNLFSMIMLRKTKMHQTVLIRSYYYRLFTLCIIGYILDKPVPGAVVLSVQSDPAL